jgi:hypothetical protein
MFLLCRLTLWRKVYYIIQLTSVEPNGQASPINNAPPVTTPPATTTVAPAAVAMTAQEKRRSRRVPPEGLRLDILQGGGLAEEEKTAKPIPVEAVKDPGFEEASQKKMEELIEAFTMWGETYAEKMKNGTENAKPGTSILVF